MKKTYSAKHKAFLFPENFSWGICALVFAVLVFLLRLCAPNLFLRIFAPVFHASDALAGESHSIISGFRNTGALAAENERLAQENSILANENQALLQKMANISALTGSVASGKNTSRILAGVIARPPESPYDTLVIAGGTNDKITLGMEVFGNGGVPIGVVSSVLSDFSRVTLFSAPGVVMNGWVGRTNMPVTVIGAGAGAMTVTMPRSAGSAVGDAIFISGPGMLPIGKIARIDGNPSLPSVTLRIAPALNLFSIAWVELRDTGRTLLLSATSTLP